MGRNPDFGNKSLHANILTFKETCKMSSLIIRDTAQENRPYQAIESFRREEAIAADKDQLTNVFVNGSSTTNQDLYTDPEEIIKLVTSTLCAIDLSSPVM